MSSKIFQPRRLHRLVQQLLSRQAAQAQIPRTTAAFSTNQNFVGKEHLIKPTSVISQSTILVQDGLEIKELPILMRIMDSMDFPFDKVTYSEGKIRVSNEHDLLFEAKLKECVSVYQVFKLLQVPGDAVTAHSAAMALKRVMHFQRNDANVDSYINKAVLQELCETICKDLGSLDSDFIIDFVQCFPGSSAFDENHTGQIINEVERRIVDSVFTVLELCRLAHIFSHTFWQRYDMKKNVFIQLASKQDEIDHFNVKQVYLALQYGDASHRYLWNILDKRVKKCWWKLDAVDMTTISQSLICGKFYSSVVLSCLSDWIRVNMHTVRDLELKCILSAFSFFMYSDEHFVNRLEQYVTAKVDTMDKGLVSMIMDYCMKIRILSPVILEAVAVDFVKNYHMYSVSNTLQALRPYGVLHFVPKEASLLFATIEHYIYTNFDSFDIADMIELLSSFVYIQRLPLNFTKKIFTPLTVAQIREISNPQRRQTVAQQFLLLHYAVLAKYPNHGIPPISQKYLANLNKSRDDRLTIFIPECRRVLDTILPKDPITGKTNMFSSYMVHDTPYDIDIYVPLLKANGNINKVALLCLMPQDYCINVEHMLGVQAMRKRHLKQLGFSVVQINYEKFSWKCSNFQAKKEYLQSLLQPILNNSHYNS